MQIKLTLLMLEVICSKSWSELVLTALLFLFAQEMINSMLLLWSTWIGLIFKCQELLRPNNTWKIFQTKWGSELQVLRRNLIQFISICYWTNWHQLFHQTFCLIYIRLRRRFRQRPHSNSCLMSKMSLKQFCLRFQVFILMTTIK